MRGRGPLPAQIQTWLMVGEEGLALPAAAVKPGRTRVRLWDIPALEAPIEQWWQRPKLRVTSRRHTA